MALVSAGIETEGSGWEATGIGLEGLVSIVDENVPVLMGAQIILIDHFELETVPVRWLQLVVVAVLDDELVHFVGVEGSFVFGQPVVGFDQQLE